MLSLPAEFDRKQGISRCWDRGARGSGITVGVIDTSLDPDHPELAGYVDDHLEFVTDDRPVPLGARETHGTSMAASIRLVAPEARIVGLSIFPESESGLRYNTRVRDAAAHAVREGIARFPAMRILNMSFAIPRGLLWRCRPGARCVLCQAVNDARAAGLAPVAAAGNTGPRDDAVECPGIAEGAITVGAILGSKDRAAFEAATPAERADHYGTSYAAAHFAGGMALLMSAAPEADVEEVQGAFERVTGRFPDGQPRRANFADALDWLVGPDEAVIGMALGRLHWVDGNRDAQRPDNTYVVEAVERVLLFAERNLIRRREFGRAAEMLGRLEATLVPDRLPDHCARLAELKGRLGAD